MGMEIDTDDTHHIKIAGRPLMSIMPLTKSGDALRWEQVFRKGERHVR